jgi:SAM-dependent methyltransferase
MSIHYSRHFYEYQKSGSLRSAEVLVPIVLEYVQPRSVLDLGCGVGTWLSVFHACGVPDIQGMDGAYVDQSMLAIDKQAFRAGDISQAADFNRRFDLAMSLEAAEHLPDACADTLVASLVRHADVVLFSAAIPFQRGGNHINEQWPDYWRNKFAQVGYVPVDCLRGRIWDNPAVQVWYRQNVLMYVKADRLPEYQGLQAAHSVARQTPLSVVHPEYFISHSRLALQRPWLALRNYYWDALVEWVKRVLPEKAFIRLKGIWRQLAKS